MGLGSQEIVVQSLLISITSRLLAFLTCACSQRVVEPKQGWCGLGPQTGERKVGPCAYVKVVKKKKKDQMTLNFCPRPESLEINNEEIFIKASGEPWLHEKVHRQDQY